MLETWRRWTATVPETVTSVGRLLRFPLLPDLPPFLSGQSYVVVEAVCQMPGDFADEVLEPLRVLDPAIDTFAPISMPELLQLHMDPPGPVPGRGDGTLLGTLTEPRRSTRSSLLPVRTSTARCCRSSCATSAGCSPTAGCRAARCRASTPSSPSSPSA